MKITLTKNGRDCLITDFRVGQFFTLLKGMPGRNKWIERELAFQPTGANIDFVMTHLQEAEWGGGAEVHRDNYIALKMQEQTTRDEKKDQLVDDTGYQFRTVPFKHQLQAFLLSRDRESFALFHEQGTGKTKTMLDKACYQYEKGNIDTLIVIAKNGVHIGWVDEQIPEHVPDRIPYQAFYYSQELRRKEYVSLFEAAKTVQGCLRIITFYIEGVRYLNDGEYGKMQDMLIQWVENSKAYMVIDESSTIKNAQADRTKFLAKLGKQAVMRRIMTGTPVTSGAQNLYGQFLFLDPRILGYESFYTFRAKFCIMGGFENKSIVGYNNLEELIKIIDGHSHRVLKKDCLDLPPKLYKRHPFELPPAHRKLYDAVRKQALDDLTAILGQENGLRLAAEISIVRALRLQQIANGLTPTEQPENLDGPTPRMDALMEEIEEATASGNKVIVWIRFTPSLRDCMKKLGTGKAVQYWSGVKEAERTLARKRFQDDEKITVFVGTSAAAYGNNLPAGGAIFHSQSSSLDLRLQSEDRCHGIGRTQGDKILYTDIEAVRTVDRKIINSLKANKELADQINQDPRSIFLEED